MRKSTEDVERQALSIDSQKDKAREMFGHLEIVDYFEESKSAFKPDNRPTFIKMVQRIKKGEANGIIAWHPDRLSRNEVDAATLTYMIRTEELKDLKFGSYNFDNSPEGIMMLQMALSQSQYYSTKLSKDVKRGFEKKLKLGQFPGLAPIGYLNDKAEKIIIKDPDRFNLVKKMWQLMLTGTYSPPRILKIANEEWSYRTRKTKRTGDKPLSRSVIYKMFTNPFYAGIIRMKGEESPGEHPTMITMEEFDRVQMLLGKHGGTRLRKYEFELKGPISCGECGCAVTAEKKIKQIKSTGLSKEYIYYHCTRKKKDINCSQKQYVLEEDLRKMALEEIKNYTIIPEFKDWALQVLRRKHKQEIKNRENIYEMQHKALVAIQKQEDKLLDALCREVISEEDYKLKKNKLQREKLKIKNELRDTEGRADKWLKLSEKAFDFVTYAAING
jgi:DNA invertase Pin-like site-specific DNA recombinase